jgi:hypothetical protein
VSLMGVAVWSVTPVGGQLHGPSSQEDDEGCLSRSVMISTYTW